MQGINHFLHVYSQGWPKTLWRLRQDVSPVLPLNPDSYPGGVARLEAGACHAKQVTSLVCCQVGQQARLGFAGQTTWHMFLTPQNLPPEAIFSLCFMLGPALSIALLCRRWYSSNFLNWESPQFALHSAPCYATQMQQTKITSGGFSSSLPNPVLLPSHQGCKL